MSLEIRMGNLETRMSGIETRISVLEHETKSQTELMRDILREVKEGRGDTKLIRQDMAEHNLEDAKQFATAKAETVAVSSEVDGIKRDLGWTKAIFAFLLTSGGIVLHWFKK